MWGISRSGSHFLLLNLSKTVTQSIFVRNLLMVSLSCRCLENGVTGG
jgi:hypothetical protein